MSTNRSFNHGTNSFVIEPVAQNRGYLIRIYKNGKHLEQFGSMSPITKEFLDKTQDRIIKKEESHLAK